MNFSEANNGGEGKEGKKVQLKNFNNGKSSGRKEDRKGMRTENNELIKVEMNSSFSAISVYFFSSCLLGDTNKFHFLMLFSFTLMFSQEKLFFFLFSTQIPFLVTCNFPSTR